MSVLSSIIFNIRERILSSDLNVLQADAAADMLAAVRAQSRSGIRQTALPIPFQSRSDLSQVAGLVPTPAAANVLELTPGSLATYSPLYPAPVPGFAYSSWKFFNGVEAAVNIAVAVPIPVGLPTWYLLEARVGETITPLFRDIKNTITGLFVPTVVPKILATTLETQWVAGVPGGGWPTPTGGEWVAIAQVQRTNVGGVVTPATLWDLRPLPSDLLSYASQAAQNRQGRFDWKIVAPNSLELTTVEPAVAQGVSLEAGAFTAGVFTALDLTTIHDVNDGAFVASTSYHLYIAPWWGLAPRQAATPYQRGRLVLSSVAPTLLPFGAVALSPSERVWANSAGLLDPGPGGAVQIGEAIYLGTVTRNALNAGFVSAYQTDRTVRVNGRSGELGQKLYTGFGPIIGPFLVPDPARLLTVQVDWNATDGVVLGIEIAFTEFGTPAQGKASQCGVRPTSLNNAFTFDYQSAYDGPDPTIGGVFISDEAGAAPAAYSIRLTPAGWEW